MMLKRGVIYHVDGKDIYLYRFTNFDQINVFNYYPSQPYGHMGEVTISYEDFLDAIAYYQAFEHHLIHLYRYNRPHTCSLEDFLNDIN